MYSFRIHRDRLHLAQTEHRIGEDIDIGNGILSISTLNLGNRSGLCQWFLSPIKKKKKDRLVAPDLPDHGEDGFHASMCPAMLILSLQGLLQNQSLETIQVCIVVLCFQQNNTAGIHLYDECMRSNEPNRTHKFVHRPQISRSPNPSQMQTCLNIM